MEGNKTIEVRCGSSSLTKAQTRKERQKAPPLLHRPRRTALETPEKGEAMCRTRNNFPKPYPTKSDIIFKVRLSLTIVQRATFNFQVDTYRNVQ